MVIPTKMAWRPNLTPAELLWRAHLQLRHWRGEHNPEKIAFWYSRRDDLLANIEHRDLNAIDPELAARLFIPARSGVLKVAKMTAPVTELPGQLPAEIVGDPWDDEDDD